jgi:hypothetical protein
VIPTIQSVSDPQIRGGSSDPIIDTITDGKSYLTDIPDKVDEEAIHKLTKEILKDPSMNIRMIPNKIEAILYKNIVRLTLNAVYGQIKKSNGHSFLFGHAIRMRYIRGSAKEIGSFTEIATSEKDVEILENVADRLLENKNINQPLIPDDLERQIYTNCLKIIVLVLGTVQSSLRMSICDYSMGFYFDPKPNAIATTVAFDRALDVLSNADKSALEAYQQKAAVDIKGSGLSFYFSNYRRALLSQVHATMFGFVLHVVQDMMDQTIIEFVGVGKIVMDLVPETKLGVEEDTSLQTRALSGQKAALRRAFFSGIGLGASLIVLIVNNNIQDGQINLQKLGLSGLNSWVKENVTSIQQLVANFIGSKGSTEEQEGDISEEPVTNLFKFHSWFRTSVEESTNDKDSATY